jgi:hypothetical protein
MQLKENMENLYPSILDYKQTCYILATIIMVLPEIQKSAMIILTSLSIIHCYW